MAQPVDVAPGSSEWLAARRDGVTATDIVTILGLSTHDSVYSLFWRKLGQVPDEPDRDRWALGRHLEPYIVERWQQATGSGVFDGGLYQSGDRPWQLATPDRSAPAVTGALPLELKSWADADRKSWEGGPPAAVRAQLLWQMDTMDAAKGYWGVVFLPSGRFDHGVIKHDCTEMSATADMAEAGCAVCADQLLMRQAGEEFYRRLTLELPPPDPDTSAATLAALRARFSRTEGKQAGVDRAVYEDWVNAANVIAEYEADKRALEILMRQQAGEAAELTVDGEVVIKRLVFDSPVKAHTRHMDYYRRVTAKGDGDGASI